MNKKLIVVGLAAVAVLLLAGESDEIDNPAYEAPDLIDQAAALWDDITDISGGVMSLTEQKNVAAFLKMIRTAEGTAGPDGYRTLVGGSLFNSFADHPRKLVTILSNGRPITSSAAGAYQILTRTWAGVKGKLMLTDFTPASQDRAAVELIRQRGALADVRAGRFGDALTKCRKEWASLPGAGYGQPEKSVGALFAAYVNAGGSVA
ncbi:glycoside hydrolase family 24 protein [Massilia sp. GCM10023247]|uniref:glycoside hydrolase family 24 protein n=1 Tax=Massilia sp. GCM10023247 TaxID=3252643 RepID=UPI0036191566